MTGEKLSLKCKIGYGFSGAVDPVVYNLFYIYFLFFLTNIVGVRPGLAGIIAFVALFWDAITDPIVGGLSDNYVSKKGRRLPWMKASVVPLAMAIILMFAPFNIVNNLAQGIYYILVCMMVWLLYTTYLIPFLALGSELSENYNDRNKLRLTGAVMGYPILMLVSSGPMWIWAWAGNQGISNRNAWAITGVVFAVLMVVLCSIGFYILRNSEIESVKRAIEAQKTKIKVNFYKVWLQCLKIKAFKLVNIWIIVYMFGFSMLNSVLVYIMIYHAGMTEIQQGTFFVVYALFTIATLPITTFFCNKYGKKPAMLVTMGQAIAVSILFYFIGINSIAQWYIFAASSVIASSSFFTFYIAYAYDCIEIDEFKTGTRKDGSMSALASFSQKFGSAIAFYSTGTILQFRGYDGTSLIQGESALNGILSLGTLFPAIIFSIAYIILLRYPVTKHKFELLSDALTKKRAGLEYSIQGFEDILQ